MSDIVLSVDVFYTKNKNKLINIYRYSSAKHFILRGKAVKYIYF